MILDELVTGFVAGLFSTGAMSLVEYPIWRRWGMEGVSEWHLNQVMVGRIMNRAPRSVVAQGLLLHFLHGGLAGIVFVLLLPSIQKVPVMVGGVGFGIILWVIALLIMKPVTGVGFRHQSLSLLPLIVSFGGHVLYGLFLGLAVTYI